MTAIYTNLTVAMEAKAIGSSNQIPSKITQMKAGDKGCGSLADRIGKIFLSVICVVPFLVYLVCLVVKDLSNKGCRAPVKHIETKSSDQSISGKQIANLATTYQDIFQKIKNGESSLVLVDKDGLCKVGSFTNENFLSELKLEMKGSGNFTIKPGQHLFVKKDEKGACMFAELQAESC